MAFFSKTWKRVLPEVGDRVTVMGMKGTVTETLVMKAAGFRDELVVVDLTNGKELPNVFNLGEIEAFCAQAPTGETVWVTPTLQPVDIW